MNAMQARRNVKRQIARNPTNIVIKRTQEVDDGAGGSYRETVELPAQTVRIFMSSMQTQTVSKVGGQIQTQSWGLLATWDADIATGDEFQTARPTGHREWVFLSPTFPVYAIILTGEATVVTTREAQLVDGRRFIVRTVSPASTGGAVIAIHADLEEVS